MFIFGLGSIIMLFVAFVMVNLALVIYIGSKELPARVFVFAIFVSLIWVVNMLFLLATSPQELYWGNFLDRLSYVLGFYVVLAYSYFCVTFAKECDDIVVRNIYLIFAILYTYFLMFTNLFVGNGFWYGEILRLHIQIWGAKHGVLPFVYDISFVVVFIIGLVYIYIASKKEQKKERLIRLKFMFWTVLIGMIPPIFVSVVLPSFGTYQYDWLGVMSSILWMGVVTYSIFKVGQLQVKVVVTELLILALLFILFIALFV